MEAERDGSGRTYVTAVEANGKGGVNVGHGHEAQQAAEVGVQITRLARCLQQTSPAHNNVKYSLEDIILNSICKD